jgi:hypothetical protein
MYKLAAIIGGFLLMAGVALAGTLTSLDKTNSPTIGSIQPVSSTQPAAGTTVRQDDRGREKEARGRANEAGEDVRGREAEARGRANEAGEDLSGPCDEAEHANDPRCAGGVAMPQGDDKPGDDRGGDDTGEDRSGSNRGPSSSSGSSDDSGSGHGGGDDRGGSSGHGGGDDD